MTGVSQPRLISKPFVAVTAATGAFFIYVGMLVPLAADVHRGRARGRRARCRAQHRGVRVRRHLRPAADRPPRRALRAPPVMIAGSLLAGLAGFLCATVNSLPPLLVLRGIAGIGEAAVFVGRRHARGRPRTAGAAGRGGQLLLRRRVRRDRHRPRSSARPCSRATASTWPSSWPAASRRSPPRCRSPCPTASVAPFDDADVGAAAALSGLQQVRAPRRHRPRPRAGLRHRRVLGVLCIPPRVRPLDRVRRLGRAVRRLQRRLPAAAPRRCPAPGTARCPPGGHDRVRDAGHRARGVGVVPRGVGAVGRGDDHRRRHGVHVPVADGAHRQPRSTTASGPSSSGRSRCSSRSAPSSAGSCSAPSPSCSASGRPSAPPCCCARSACGCCGPGVGAGRLGAARACSRPRLRPRRRRLTPSAPPATPRPPTRASPSSVSETRSSQTARPARMVACSRSTTPSATGPCSAGTAGSTDASSPRWRRPASIAARAARP